MKKIAYQKPNVTISHVATELPLAASPLDSNIDDAAFGGNATDEEVSDAYGKGRNNWGDGLW